MKRKKRSKQSLLIRFKFRNFIAALLVFLSFCILYFGSLSDIYSPKLFLFKAAYFPLVTVFLVLVAITYVLFLRSWFGALSVIVICLVLVPTILPNMKGHDVSPSGKPMFTLASFSAMTRSRNGKDIRDFILGHKPDVLCLQEATEEDEEHFKELYPYTLRYGGNKLVLSHFQINAISDSGSIQHLELEVSDSINRSDVSRSQKITLLNMHMPRQYREGKYADEARTDLLEKTRNQKKIIMCGDFNMTPKNTAYEHITRQLGFKDAQMNQTWSYGATFPNGNRNLAKLGAWLRIDYIFYKGLLSADTKVINASSLSDHKAVMTTFYAN